MNILFVHQNFPGQYLRLAPELAARGHTVRALSMNPQPALPGVMACSYVLERGNTAGIHPLVEEFESKVLRGEAVAKAALRMAQEGFTPDVVCVHPGWGEALFIKDVWPRARVLAFLEYYYHYEGSDVDFDPEFFRPGLASAAKIRLKNAHNLLSLEVMDHGVAPMVWQKAQYPVWAQDRISVIHDGIDTQLAAPNAQAELVSEQAGIKLRAGDEVITFVNRNLEPCRGFHVFMRALAKVMVRRPAARVVIVGGDAAGYGPGAPGGESWRQYMLRELDGQLDLSRIHFVGKVPYAVFLGLLQVSAVHVYLTYPFVLSWSMLEAMSVGCAVIGSRTAPVEEVIQDGQNGLLVDFFDAANLADRIGEVLERPADFAAMRVAARETILDRYDLRTVCLPQHVALVERLARQ